MRMKSLVVEPVTALKVAAAEARLHAAAESKQSEEQRSPPCRQIGPRPSVPSRVARLFSQVEEPMIRTVDAMLTSAKKRISERMRKLGCHIMFRRTCTCAPNPPYVGCARARLGLLNEFKDGEAATGGAAGAA